MVDLSGKVALVTGGTRGIGRGIVDGLAEAGASVVASSRTAERVEAVEKELRDAGHDALCLACDVRNPDDCERMVEQAVERFGGVDILVNNAGLGIFRPIQEMSAEEWLVQVETNLNGVFYCSRAAIPHLVERGEGWIINIGSIAGRNANPGGAAYNATKWGLLGMTEAMMLDLRHEGVRVTTVMPGSVETHFFGEEPVEETWRLLPSDVARAVLDLLAYPSRALPSRLELRPSRPPKKS